METSKIKTSNHRNHFLWSRRQDLNREPFTCGTLFESKRFNFSKCFSILIVQIMQKLLQKIDQARLPISYFSVSTSLTNSAMVSISIFLARENYVKITYAFLFLLSEPCSQKFATKSHKIDLSLFSNSFGFNAKRFISPAKIPIIIFSLEEDGVNQKKTRRRLCVGNFIAQNCQKNYSSLQISVVKLKFLWNNLPDSFHQSLTG